MSLQMLGAERSVLFRARLVLSSSDETEKAGRWGRSGGGEVESEEEGWEDGEEGVERDVHVCQVREGSLGRGDVEEGLVSFA
jgi:hypothetical protein